MRTIERLVFVYDAKAGGLAAFASSARKMLLLKSCALCTITHGVLGEKKEWRACRSALPVPIDYRHRDDLPEMLRSITAGVLPCIVAVLDGGTTTILLDSIELDDCSGKPPELVRRVQLAAFRRGFVLEDAASAGQSAIAR